MTQSSLLRTISRCSWRSSTRHSNGCSSSHSAGDNRNHGLRCFADGTTLQRLRHMPRRPVPSHASASRSWNPNRQQSLGGRHFHDTYFFEIALGRSAALGGLLWKVLQPQEGISTCSEPMLQHRAQSALAWNRASARGQSGRPLCLRRTGDGQKET
jgi:hypothetical protein